MDINNKFNVGDMVYFIHENEIHYKPILKIKAQTNIKYNFIDYEVPVREHIKCMKNFTQTGEMFATSDEVVGYDTIWISEKLLFDSLDKLNEFLNKRIVKLQLENFILKELDKKI